jgi:hypothetical protein
LEQWFAETAASAFSYEVQVIGLQWIWTLLIEMVLTLLDNKIDDRNW